MNKLKDMTNTHSELTANGTTLSHHNNRAEARAEIDRLNDVNGTIVLFPPEQDEDFNDVVTTGGLGNPELVYTIRNTFS